MMKFLIVSLLICLSCSEPTHKEYYSDGSLKSVYELRDDNRNNLRIYNGTGKKFYKSGELEQVSKWVDGIKQGSSYSYYRNGTVKIKAYFQNGEQNGWTYFYDSIGNLRGKSFYRNSQLDGVFEEYFSSGKLSRRGTSTIHDSKLQAYEYYESGKPKQCYIKIGDSTVYQKTYDESGVNMFTLFPISTDQSTTKICFTLDHSIYDADSLITRLHIVNTSRSESEVSDFRFESEGTTVCIDRKLQKGFIIKCYICEIHKKSNTNQGCMPFQYDILRDSILMNPYS